MSREKLSSFLNVEMTTVETAMEALTSLCEVLRAWNPR